MTAVEVRFPFWISCSSGINPLLDDEGDPYSARSVNRPCRACPDNRVMRGNWVVELGMNFGSFGLALPRMFLCQACYERLLETIRPYEESRRDPIESLLSLRVAAADVLESLAPIFDAVRQLPPISGRKLLPDAEKAVGRLRGALMATGSSGAGPSP